MNNITPIEKKIVKYICALNTKEDIMEDLKDRQYTSSRIGSEAMEFLGISINGGYKKPNTHSIAVQYAYYAYKHYDDIKTNKFPKEIERIETLRYTIDGVEWVKREVGYSVEVFSLPSFKDEILKDIDENFWEYDPEYDETYDEETLDSAFETPEFDSKTEVSNNVIGG